MKAVLQRVARAEVRVDGEVVGQIERGLLVFLGVMAGDRLSDVTWLVDRVVGYRVFEDEQRKMNRSLLDVGGALLVVSQFTLAADGRKGRRPSFDSAAKPDEANDSYLAFVEQARQRGVRVEAGRFGAFMEVSLVNDGPATFLLETPT